MNNNLLIFFGCGVGGLMRYWISTYTYSILGKSFPYGTLLVNASGSLVMGILYVLLVERFSTFAPQLRALLLIGFLGGYTTFSTFSIETVSLMENGSTLNALLNIFLSCLLCIGGAWLGVFLGRQL